MLSQLDYQVKQGESTDAYNTRIAGLRAAVSAPVVPPLRVGDSIGTGENFPGGLPGAPIVVQPTVGQIYGTGEDPALIAARAAQMAGAKSAANQLDPTDPAVQAQIRSSALAAFQAETDATNAVYADKLKAAAIQGQGRLGSATASQARGGLLGSSFGAAQTDTVTQGNEDIANSIRNEQQLSLANITDKANTQATKEIADRTSARKAGVDSYVQYLGDAQTRKGTNATTAAKILLANKQDPTKLDANTLQSVLNGYGISQEDLNKAYAAEKPGYDAAQVIVAQTAAKNAQDAATAAKGLNTTVSAGSSVIGSDGKVLYTAPAGSQLKWTVTGMDKFGDNVYGFVDEAAGKIVNGAMGGGSSAGGGMPAANPGGQAPAVTNSDYTDLLSGKTPAQATYFNALSDQEKTNVMGLINGDILLSDIAKGGIKGSKAAQTYNAEAMKVDPTYSENINKTRFQFIKNWNDPQQKSYGNRVTINTALGHIAELKDAVGALGNIQGFNPANSFKNIISQAVGNPAVPDFNMITTALASEYAGLYKGASPTDPEIESWKAAIQANYSPATLDQLISRGVKLAGDRLNSITNEYKSSMGKYPATAIIQQDSIDKLKTAGVDTSALENIIGKSSPSAAGTTRMKGPDGLIYDIPNANVEGAKKDGAVIQ